MKTAQRTGVLAARLDYNKMGWWSKRKGQNHFGRMVKFLEEIGEPDNTLIVVISDNGASSEGGPVGSLNEMCSFNNEAESHEDNLKEIDELGGVDVFSQFALGWTNAGNTSFRRRKRETYCGDSTDLCIVSWPKGVRARGEVRIC